ncbi:hypothetical protein EMIHUDRAFT_423905 [Emiliania huxleyi CCMP1516]|uniref:Uncharacterized protein n=2 Tax=Emiliania huxleyi TaxID=2903 RepID=A0A0D3K525_EMIH1|nr:hypothetical protein EMIHUDRAFT_470552 [Emiliania huxleyi CCMP1516]XP_005783289.1 hypothetical protein EMIHUDRAFT_423905 [Emiliania huxleyi CCMP1516]EOD15459.1 hypothetical protein EMIHUDRAFT_470552 [Emiliania huxleyi CCMP1516]EOD30860.1 hypothetical protein EMIHUDRAFT_423905 [Emiliania huxleyi CCMP1516]|eukprot:XP_005767888.1 hypothetical protein EMIHUDRAFT_470552 [Emiliania huxleyi CCMP1516]
MSPWRTSSCSAERGGCMPGISAAQREAGERTPSGGGAGKSMPGERWPSPGLFADRLIVGLCDSGHTCALRSIPLFWRRRAQRPPVHRAPAPAPPAAPGCWPVALAAALLRVRQGRPVCAHFVRIFIAARELEC